VDNIVVLPNKQVDKTKLEPNKLYIQIASTKPIFDATDTPRDTVWEQHFNTTKFLFESAYALGGKLQSEMSKQQKKKDIFHSRVAFPSANNRLPVIRKEEIILSPIEYAIELIEDRVANLKTELNSKPPRINVLQQILQGSVVPMVNEGPLKICEVYLTDPTPFPPHNIAALRKAIKLFSTYCDFALKLNKRLITQEHMEFHKMMENHYGVMKVKIAQYVGE